MFALLVLTGCIVLEAYFYNIYDVANVPSVKIAEDLISYLCPTAFIIYIRGELKWAKAKSFQMSID